MTAPVTRPSETQTIANLMERVRTLEALVPSAATGGGTTACTNCYPVPPEFASCVDLRTGGAHIPPTVIGFQPVPASIPTSKVEIRHYQCNYAAGFRIVIHYTGDYKRLELFGEIWHEGSFYARQSIGTYGPLLGPTDTGYHVLHLDPAGVGDPTDAWQCYLGVENNSLLVDGQIGDGFFGTSYQYFADAAIYLPSPRYEGMIMTSIGSPPQWMALEAGAVGSKLTINVAGKPEWV